MLDESIFKAYDIRGIYPSSLNEDLAYKLGLAYAKLLRQENPNKENLNIVVGYDMRLSSESLYESLTNGLIDMGVNVINIGLVSTPTFYFAVSYYNYDGGIQISASHNPKEYNGFKMTRAKALPISSETGIYWLRDQVKENIFELSDVKGKIIEKENVLQDHVNYALDYIDLSNLKPIHIVIDAANAMGAQFLDKFFKKLPCKITKMNFELDGTFPSHEADPMKDENIKDLKEMVLAKQADFGIATDGDGDRIFFIDNKGELISPALVRGLIAKILLRENPNSKVCYDVRPGKITYDLIVENDGIPIQTRVGHSLIKEKAISEDAIFAGESSGHFFLKMPHGYYEAPMIVTALLLDEFSKSNVSISDYITPYNRYFHTGELNFDVADKDAVIKKIKEYYKNETIETLDGVSIINKEWWFNIRPSNTESKLRLNLEAISDKIMNEKKLEVVNVIKS